MTYSDYRKAFTQLRAKPVKLKKYIKNNAPKPRKFGLNTKRCIRCGRPGGHISNYNIHMCRHCFRETATMIGFKKYS